MRHWVSCKQGWFYIRHVHPVPLRCSPPVWLQRGAARLKGEKWNHLAHCNIWQFFWSLLYCMDALALQSVITDNHFIWKDWMAGVAFHLLWVLTTLSLEFDTVAACLRLGRRERRLSAQETPSFWWPLPRQAPTSWVCPWCECVRELPGLDWVLEAQRLHWEVCSVTSLPRWPSQGPDGPEREAQVTPSVPKGWAGVGRHAEGRQDSSAHDRPLSVPRRWALRAMGWMRQSRTSMRPDSRSCSTVVTRRAPGPWDRRSSPTSATCWAWRRWPRCCRRRCFRTASRAG